jgi:hypothetical protein
MQGALLYVPNIRNIVGLLIPNWAPVSSVEIVVVVLRRLPKTHLETAIRGDLDFVLKVLMDVGTKC